MTTRIRTQASGWLALALLASTVSHCSVDDRTLTNNGNLTSTGGGSNSTGDSDSGGTTTGSDSGGSGGASGGSGGNDSTETTTTASSSSSTSSTGSSGSGGAPDDTVKSMCTAVAASSPVIADFGGWHANRFGGDGFDGTLSGGGFVYGLDSDGNLSLDFEVDSDAGSVTVAGTVEDYAGFGLWFDVRQGDGFACADCCLDAGDCTGISFEISGTDGISVRPILQGYSTYPKEGTPPKGGCLFTSEDTKYDDCQFPKGPALDMTSSPETVEVPFSAFDTGVPEVIGGAKREVIGLQWEFDWTRGDDAYPVELTLSNVQFYGGDGCGSAARVIPAGSCEPILTDADLCDDVVTAAGDAPVIDDFEDGDDLSYSGDGRDESAWYFTGDSEGASQLSPPSGTFVVQDLEQPRDGSMRAFHSVGDPAQWAVAGVFLPPWVGDDTHDCYDASAYTGIGFWARGSGFVTARADMLKTMPVADGGACSAACDAEDCMCCRNQYQKQFELTDDWQYYAVPWEDLQVSITQTRFDLSQLVSISFVFDGYAEADGEHWDSWLDDVGFLTD